MLLARHGRDEATRRLVEGTRRSCEAHGCPEKFDAELTRRWGGAIADGLEDDPPPATLDELLARRPELRRGDLFGRR